VSVFLTQNTASNWHTPTGHLSDTCELLIFRKSVISDALVNLRGSDEKYMEAVVKWYVLVFCTLAIN